jgi:predicted RNase H-like nuclease (RuvC/YqgF family)
MPLEIPAIQINTPMVEILTAITGIVVAAAGIVWPIIQVLRKFNIEKDSAIERYKAEITLYEQLREQIEVYKRELDEALCENRRLWDIIKNLEGRLKKIEEIEMDLDKLRNKLNEKDEIISRRDHEISELREMLEIKERKIKELEIRVAYLESLRQSIQNES